MDNNENMVNKPETVTIKRWKNTIKSFALYPYLYFICNKRLKSHNSILVVGAPRSGTSWLGDIIARKTEGRVVFEPTSAPYTQFPLFRDTNLICAEADTKWPELEDSLADIFSGKLCPNYFVDRDNKPGIYQVRVVKEVRLGWILPFIRARFPDVTIIYIIRHPFDTMRSQKQISAFNQLHISRSYYQQLTNHPLIRQKIWDRYGLLKIDSEDFVDYKIASWACYQRFVFDVLCIDDTIYLCNYEDLAKNSNLVTKKLGQLLQSRGFEVQSLDEATLTAPSRTTIPSNMPNVKAKETTARSKDFFSTDQLERSKETLAHFELNNLYLENFSPGPMLERRAFSSCANSVSSSGSAQ